MDGEVVAVDHDLFVAVHDLDGGIELCLVRFAEEGVIADDVHADGDRHIGDQNADGAQADDAEGLAGDLGTDELALALLDLLAHLVAGALEGLGPLDALDDLAGGKQQTGEDQLLDRVGVGTGGVEDTDALLGADVLGDVVGAGARSGDGEQVVAECHLVHGSGTNEDRVGIGNTVSAGVVVAETLGADGSDLI